MTKVLIVAVLCFLGYGVYAQDTVYLKKEAKNKVYTDRAPQVVFFELGGPGLLSVNYDRRFAKQTDGWGFRAGIGYLNPMDFSLLSVPVGINYLAGKKGKYFEVGLNESLYFINANRNPGYGFVDIFDTHVENSKTISLTSLTFGYRSQPLLGGLCFRVGLMPYTTFSGSTNLSAYLSFGYNF